MLTQEEKDLISAVRRRIAQGIPDFKPRPPQSQMIAMVANAFADGDFAMIEAPTGVGKTLGYLIPGVALAAIRKKRLIVSTGTTALQRQIAEKDLPIVLKALAAEGVRVDAAIAKGRERFVCTARLAEKSQHTDLFTHDPNALLYVPLHRALSDKSWNGDRDSLQMPLPADAWGAIANTRHTCTKERCPSFKQCAFYVRQTELKTAKVIIANHDLVLTSLARTNGGLFGKWDENLFVFDEAHHLADKANAILSSSLTLSASFLETLPSVLGYLLPPHAKREIVQEARVANTLFADLGRQLQSISRPSVQAVRFAHGIVPDKMRETLLTVSEVYARVSGLLETVKAKSPDRGDAMQRQLQLCDQMLARLNEDRATIGAFLSTEDAAPTSKLKPRARWAEQFSDRWILKVSPFDAGPALRMLLWSQASSAVLTSATLVNGGEFSGVARSLGIPGERLKTQTLISPFDFSDTRFVIPSDAPLPTLTDEHTAFVAQYVQSLAGGLQGGMLVCFASRQQMLAVRGMLPEDLQKAVQTQDDGSVAEILTVHAERIQQTGSSILFGLAAFAEGLDLPGALCTKVLVPKLPFPSPDDPLIAAELEYLERRKLPTFPVLLSAASIRFRQTCGRLKRKESDSGEVHVLDRRVLDKSYGKSLLRSVPMRIDVV